MDLRALADASVVDVDGGRTRLGEQWRTRPAVVVWLRHFGCLYCVEQARAAVAAQASIEAAGGRLVLVGNGSAEQARDFRDRHATTATVLTDPALGSYRAIAARSGLLSTLGPATWGGALRALRSGARQSAVKGHPLQQGGVLVIVPGARIVYAHVSKFAGDHPPMQEVVDALRGDAAGAPARVAATG